MNPMYDEALADAIVEHNLAKYKWYKEHKRMNVFLYKNEDGKICQAINFAEVERDSLTYELSEAKEVVANLEEALRQYDQLATDAPAETSETVQVQEPVETPVVEPEAPVAPIEQPLEIVDQPQAPVIQ